jgi:hypothetical protein
VIGPAARAVGVQNVRSCPRSEFLRACRKLTDALDRVNLAGDLREDRRRVPDPADLQNFLAALSARASTKATI